MNIKNKILFLILIFYLFNCIISVKSQKSLGEYSIDSSIYTIDTTSVNTEFNFLIDNNLKLPKVQISLLNGNIENIDQILKISENNSKLIFGDYSNEELSEEISIANDSLILSEITVKVDVTTPENYQFLSFTLNLGSGNSNINGLLSNSVVINNCNNDFNIQNNITLNNVNINSYLNICSDNDLNINNLIVSEHSNLNIKTSSNLNLNFFNGYSGSILISSEDSPNLIGACSIDMVNSISQGQCNNNNGFSNSNLTISAKSVEAVVTASSCPSVDPSWRPTVAPSSSIVSPSLMTVQPAVDFNLNSNNLRYMAFYGASDTTITPGPDTNGFTITYSNWGPDSHLLFYKDCAPALKAGNSYQLSFSFKLGQTLGSYNKYSNMTIYFYDSVDVDPVNDQSTYFYAYDHVPLYSKTITGNFASTSYVSFNTTITPTDDIGQSFMAIQINRTTSTGSSPTSIIFNNLKFTIPSKTITTPTLLAKDSELVVLPKPSTSLDPQDLTTCPYLDTTLKHWHDPSIWSGGSVPSPSSTITLPTNTKVLISPCSISSTETYTKIIIPSTSQLIFFDADITMNIKDIYVQGKLIMGTSKCRYNANINLVFNGNKTTSDTIAQYFGSKGIAVASGGFISVQGKQYHNTWTKLAATAWSGDYTIWVQDSINWEVGQEVLITTSIMEDEEHNQNEVKIIQSIQGKAIQFTTPLKYYHYGGQEYQSEVALLSRRIVFQSNPSSDSDSFGGHVLVSGEGQFSGLRLNKMGQKNIKGRYPLHYHLANNVTNSYISDCSVTNSYYRCYTIHGTNNVTLTRNVAFDINGHCYYFEDGVEVDNTLSYNFGSYVHTIYQTAAGNDQYGQDFTESDLLRQPADVSAGVYYITNAWNTIFGNAASGGWAGFSFPNLMKPIGNHINVSIVPSQYPLKYWNGNTAHSSGYQWEFGGSIYVGGDLSTDSSTGLLEYSSGRNSRETYLNGNENSTPLWMRFNNTKGFLSNRFIDHWGSRVEVVGLESHDNNRPATLFGEAWFSKAIVNGQSGNILSYSPRGKYDRQGFQYYDTLVQTIVSDINFRNFIKKTNPASNEEDNKVFISMTHSDVFKPQCISASRNISYTNVATSQIIGHSIVDTGSSRYFNFIDSDGTATKRNVPTIVGSHEKWWMFDNTCSFNTDWQCYVCNKGTREVGNLDITIPNLIDGEEHDTSVYVGNVSLFGTSTITDDRKSIITNNVGITGVTDIGWYINFNIGSPTSMDISMKQVPYGHFILLAIRYPTGTTFNIYSVYTYYVPSDATKNFTMTTSVSNVYNGDGSKYYFDGTHLFIKIVNFRLSGNTENEYFVRGGASIPDVYWGMYLYIRASNTQTLPVNGFFKNLSDVRPTYIFS